MRLMEWSKGVWFKTATPKYSFHIWTAMRNRLSTCDRIQKWNPSINPYVFYASNMRRQEIICSTHVHIRVGFGRVW